MDWLIAFFQKNPVIPVFLTLGLGFWLGKVKIKSFALGSVAATLIVGVVIGQMKISVPDMLKTVFFLFFLFSTGYGVGPQFFRAFKGGGFRMLGFAVVEALVCAGLVILGAKIMGYGNGVAAGLFAGSQTVSACLGLLSDTVKEMPLEDLEREHLLLIIPACYAVTYIFGTVGTAWFLSNVGPSMLGGLTKVKEDVAKIEEEMDSGGISLAPGLIPARRPVGFRAYEVSNDFLKNPATVSDIEKIYDDAGYRVIIERVRINGIVENAMPDQIVSPGDHIVLGGRREDLVTLKNPPGPEVVDAELLNFGAERTPVTIASGKIDGMSLSELRQQVFMDRIVISTIKRNGMNIPLKNKTELHSGDTLTLVGWPRDVAAAAAAIGYADRDTDATDMVFVGLGIAAGCIIGALSIRIKGIPMAMGVSVGALIIGLLMGWFRAKRPSFGHIPSSALWIFNNLGINMFIAVLGLTAGGALMHGIREAGVMIIAVGALLTLVGLVINILIASKLFRFSAPETLGCVAGGRCCVAAIGAVQDTLSSDVPNLSFTVCYAVANVSLVFSSLLVLFMV